MNKQKFVEFLRHPHTLDARSLQELESVLKEYPYFQNARTLVAKGSKQLKSKDARYQVNVAAIYATDRALLKRYINDQLIFLSPLEVHESHEADNERELKRTIKNSRVANAQLKREAPSPKAQPKKKVVRRPGSEEIKRKAPVKTSAPTPSDLDNIIEELNRDLEALKENRAKLDKIENDLAEQEAVEAAVKKATAQPKKSAKKLEEVEEDIPEAHVAAEDIPETDVAIEDVAAEDIMETDVAVETASADEIVLETPEVTENPTEETSKESQATDTTSEKPKKASKSRSARSASKTKKVTKQASSEKPSPAPKKTTTKAKKATAKKGTTRKTNTSEKSPAKENKPQDDDQPDTKIYKGNASTKKVSDDQESIISDFIKTNPSISPANKAKTNIPSEDLSSGSSELHPDIASEYLAQIYHDQGSYDRAIQIYEALIVRFPEKSVYFADIIKKINEQR